MSISTAKPPLKDPARVPTAEDVDRHLGQFSRYARVVRGAARVAGLSSRLAWTHHGWVEQLRLEEAVLGTINLVKVPPVAEIPVGHALEAAVLSHQPPESVRQALAHTDGSHVKWVEAELTGPFPADAMASLISVKTELIRAGAVPVTAAERPKPTARPESEGSSSARPISRTVQVVRPRAAASAKPKTAAPRKTARPTPARSVRKAKPAPAKKAAKPVKKSVKVKRPASRKPAAKSVRAKRR